MPSLIEIRLALYGAWRLLLLDRRGITAFDGSLSGALHSLWAVVITCPLYFAASFIAQWVTPPEPLAPLNQTVALVGTILRWPLWLLVIYAIIRWYGKRQRFWLFVVSSNWTQIFQSLGRVLVYALSAGAMALGGDGAAGAAPVNILGVLAGLTALLASALLLGLFVYEWYVAWVSLDDGIALPTLVLLLDLVSDLGIDKLAAAYA